MKRPLNKTHTRLIVLYILANTSLSIPTLLISYYLMHRQTAIKQTAFLLISALLFICGSTCINYICEMNIHTLNNATLYSKLTTAWRRILSLTPHAATKFNLGQLGTMLSDYESAIAGLNSHLPTLINDVLLQLFLFLYLFTKDTTLTLIYLLTQLTLVAIKISLYPTISKQIGRHLSIQAKSNALMSEALHQIHKIKTSHNESIVHKNWHALLLASKHILLRATQLETYTRVIDMAGLGLLLLISIYNDASALFLLFAGQLMMMNEKLSTDLFAVLNCRSAIKQLKPILKQKPSSNPYTYELHPFIGDIQLRHISFQKLRDISMHIPAGSFIALTGASGTGKSTLLRLILGLERDYHGSILFDHHDIRHLTMPAVRKQIGVVLQTSTLFSGTIFSNIGINQEITLDEAWRLARLVGLEDDINAMPMKMFTYLSDHPGDSLSGGQRQKILIARALASQPSILLLDEATSALDEESQTHIFNHLASLNITRLVIAHRVSTIKHADKIYQLNNGVTTEIP